ncbi:hypothetical protein LINGRAHAP2_LOCUS13226 [Linum grandiflorum]
MRTGVVIRNERGEFVLAAVHQLEGHYTPEMVEAMTVEFGLQLAIKHRFEQVVVESDRMIVVQTTVSWELFFEVYISFLVLLALEFVSMADKRQT